MDRMAQMHAITCGLPFVQRGYGEQTKRSIALRVTAVALGTLATAVAILILTRVGVLGFDRLSRVYGWSILAAGTVLVGVGVSVKCVDKRGAEKAATKIQRLFRGHRARAALQRKIDAAIGMQCLVRGYRARKVARALRQQRRSDAATNIQRSLRGYLARKTVRKLKEQKEAAIKIQRLYRNYQARLAHKREAAARKIQSVWQAHAKRYFLEDLLLARAVEFVEHVENLEDIPQAASGNSRVYLPVELPIVLKASGPENNRLRLEKMKQARLLCDKNGYRHLVVPRASIYGKFIIESRLPIGDHHAKGEIGFYIENRKRFTPAVKEFVGFICQSFMHDIVGATKDPYNSLSKTPMGRYDNVALYLEGGQGKIGLVDLETFSPKPFRIRQKWCFFRCERAVCLFPYHLEEILTVAKTFDPNIEHYRQRLEALRKGALKRFKIVYHDHLAFVQRKGITPENPTRFDRLGAERVEELKSAIEKMLRKKHNDGWLTGCLGEDPDKTVARFNKEAFPAILEKVYRLIERRLERGNQFFQEREKISSTTKLLLMRTFRFGRHYPIYEDLIDFIWGLFGSNRRFVNLPVVILDTILEEFVKGGTIAYYNPRFGDDGTKCIFC